MAARRSFDCHENLEQVYCSLIAPVLKTGKEPYQLQSYRPVSLLNLFSKVVESEINHQIEEHTEAYNLMSKIQFAYTRGKSIHTALAQIMSDAYKMVISKGIPSLVALDLKPAFNKCSYWRIARQMKKDLKISGI